MNFEEMNFQGALISERYAGGEESFSYPLIFVRTELMTF